MADVSIGSLFSGIGGLELGLERAGLGPVKWQAECAEYPRRVLQKHWPEVHRYGRVEDVDANADAVGVVCGGFPCQDISQAGRKAGLSGERSGLWREFRRVVAELRPRWVVIENNGHRWRAWVPAVRRALHGLWFASLCLRVRASELGAWHRRSRAFVVANSDGVLVREQSRGRTRAHWEAALLAARARAPWAPADPHEAR
ncbi:MAG: DNA cytosine methyltransferase, partial [Planctomycetota bacterium]